MLVDLLGQQVWPGVFRSFLLPFFIPPPGQFTLAVFSMAMLLARMQGPLEPPEDLLQAVGFDRLQEMQV